MTVRVRLIASLRRRIASTLCAAVPVFLDVILLAVSLSSDLSAAVTVTVRFAPTGPSNLRFSTVATQPVRGILSHHLRACCSEQQLRISS